MFLDEGAGIVVLQNPRDLSLGSIRLVKKDEKEEYFIICDIEEDIGDFFKIGFNSQILNANKARYKGEKIEIIKRVREIPDYGIDRELEIKLENGEVVVVDVRDLEFQFNLKENV